MASKILEEQNNKDLKKIPSKNDLEEDELNKSPITIISKKKIKENDNMIFETHQNMNCSLDEEQSFEPIDLEELEEPIIIKKNIAKIQYLKIDKANEDIPIIVKPNSNKPKPSLTTLDNKALKMESKKQKNNIFELNDTNEETDDVFDLTDNESDDGNLFEVKLLSEDEILNIGYRHQQNNQLDRKDNRKIIDPTPTFTKDAKIYLEDCSDLNIIVYQNSIARGLKEKLGMISDKNDYAKFDFTKMKKKLFWLYHSTIYFCRLKDNKYIEPAEKKFPNYDSTLIPRSSYDFCKNKLCNMCYQQQESSCDFAHYPHDKIAADIYAVITYLEKYKDKNVLTYESEKEQLIKSINTIAFTINHMLKELRFVETRFQGKSDYYHRVAINGKTKSHKRDEHVPHKIQYRPHVVKDSKNEWTTVVPKKQWRKR